MAIYECKNCGHLLESYKLTKKAIKRTGKTFGIGHKRENDLGYCLGGKSRSCGCSNPEPEQRGQ